jgi:hypothetical protein
MTGSGEISLAVTQFINRNESKNLECGRDHDPSEEKNEKRRSEINVGG